MRKLYLKGNLQHLWTKQKLICISVNKNRQDDAIAFVQIECKRLKIKWKYVFQERRYCPFWDLTFFYSFRFLPKEILCKNMCQVDMCCILKEYDHLKHNNFKRKYHCWIKFKSCFNIITSQGEVWSWKCRKFTCLRHFTC